MQSVQSPGVLRDGPPPGHWERQEEGVQTRIVESLSDMLAGRHHHARLIGGNRGEIFSYRLPLLLAHSGPQDNEVTHMGG